MAPITHAAPQEWYGQTWVDANATDTRAVEFAITNDWPPSPAACEPDPEPRPKRSDFWRAILRIPRDRDLRRPEVAMVAPKTAQRRWFAQMGKDRRLTRSSAL